MSSSEQSPARSNRDPVLIFGIAPRSGTNFLHDLITSHPDAGSTFPIAENFFNHFGTTLERYARQVTTHWAVHGGGWHDGIPEDADDALMASLGDGLLGFLRRYCDAPVMVGKTPSAENLDLVFRLFPTARVLIVIRDGRAVVESSVRSNFGHQFGSRYDVFTEQWTNGARAIDEFVTAFSEESDRYRLVRYEDLVVDLQAHLPAIISFCGLPLDRYDFDAADNLPVRGSSTFGQGLHQPPQSRTHNVSWEPIEKTEEFQPLRRWESWSSALHQQFNAIAGEYMQRLGYEIRTETADGEPLLDDMGYR